MGAFLTLFLHCCVVFQIQHSPLASEADRSVAEALQGTSKVLRVHDAALRLLLTLNIEDAWRCGHVDDLGLASSFRKRTKFGFCFFGGSEAKRRRRRRSWRTRTICQNKCLFFVLAVKRVRRRRKSAPGEVRLTPEASTPPAAAEF